MKLFLSLFLLIVTSAYAQKYTISGYIQDAKTGEKLIGAGLYDKNHQVGTTANTYGFFSISLPKDSVTLLISYVGYNAEIKKFYLDKDIQLNIDMQSSTELQEIEVVAEKAENISQSTQMSTISIPIQQIKSIPALLGEVDVLKVIQLLPGVHSGGEGTSGFYVRGGGPDQNLILLDGTPVYNASHLFGFFSVFNADAINNIELIKGGFPARFGGRLSSVLDISMKEGNLKEYHADASIGLISSKLMIEGPIIKDKSSFIISGRRTYIDVLARPIMKMMPEMEGTTLGYYFYDVNAKLNYKVGDKDRIYLSVYTGDDKFYVKEEPYSYEYNGETSTYASKLGLGWGNITSAFRWNHQYNSKLFGNATLTYSRYKFYVNEEYSEEITTSSTNSKSEYKLEYLSGIYDWAGKVDFDYMPSPNHFIKFGSNYIYHTFTPGASTYQFSSTGSNDLDSTLGAGATYAHEVAAYVEDDITVTKHLKSNVGLRWSGFDVRGKFYQSLEPRLSLRYLFAGDWSVKLAYSYMQQYLHLLSNSNIGLPTDLWVPTTDSIPPQYSHQVAGGVAKTFFDDYLFSIEGYYKTMSNLIEYKEGASFFDSQSSDWEDKIEIGKGWAYGAEFFIQKKTGKFSGWIGYTLSWTFRQFENLNFGEVYYDRYDRRHDISLVGSYKLNDKFDFSATWVYGTGNAVTMPTVRYMPYTTYLNSNSFWISEVEYYDHKNNFRMASYHRLDIGMQYHKKHKHFDSILSVGVYNAYNRKNPYFYYFGQDDNGNRSLVRVSLFQVIPSVAYSISF